MGHKNSKLEAVIGTSYTCPSCQEVFKPDTPSKEVNEHIINCSHYSKSIDSNDLFSPFSLKPTRKKTTNNKNNSKLDALEIKDYIKTRKINWIEGCDTINISRENCLEESIVEIKNVNLWREVKINFKGEVSYDAGGLFREWFIILIEELEKKEKGIFERAECDEISYVFNKNLNEDSYWA